MKDYLSAAFALLAATSQAAVLQADATSDVTAKVTCYDQLSKQNKEYDDYCYSPEDPSLSAPPEACCWLYPEANFGGNQVELCYQEMWYPGHRLHRTETIWHSFLSGTDQENMFDDKANSWQCGANAAVQACEDTVSTDPNDATEPWQYDCIGENGPLFTGGSNAGNTNLDLGSQNVVSAFVIKPLTTCTPQLTVYSEPHCTGESRVILTNQLTEAELLSIFNDNSNRIKSFYQPENSTVKIYQEEQLQGAFVGFTQTLPGETVCASAVLTEDQNGLLKGDALPQKSLSFDRWECASPQP